jgi:hypothetical protein
MSIQVPFYNHDYDNVQTAIKTYYINVDSRDRDRTAWSSSNRFEVQFNPNSGYNGAQIVSNYKNIISIELVNVIYPNTNNVLNQQYLYLNIPEITGMIDTTSGGRRYFAKLIPSNMSGQFVYNNDLVERTKRMYPFADSRLHKLTLEFRKPNGDLFDFGTDTLPPNEVNPLLQTSVMFKIVVKETLGV